MVTKEEEGDSIAAKGLGVEEREEEVEVEGGVKEEEEGGTWSEREGGGEEKGKIWEKEYFRKSKWLSFFF